MKIFKMATWALEFLVTYDVIFFPGVIQTPGWYDDNASQIIFITLYITWSFSKDIYM